MPYGKRFRRYSLPKPVKVGEEYDVKISEVGSKGDGIARIKNFVIFVAETKKGDSVRIKITEVYNTFAVAKKIEKELPEATDITEKAVEEAEKEAEE